MQSGVRARSMVLSGELKSCTALLVRHGGGYIPPLCKGKIAQISVTQGPQREVPGEDPSPRNLGNLASRARDLIDRTLRVRRPLTRLYTPPGASVLRERTSVSSRHLGRPVESPFAPVLPGILRKRYIVRSVERSALSPRNLESDCCTSLPFRLLY